VPVGAYPVPGPLDMVGDAAVGRLDWDLGAAALGALEIPAEARRAYALQFTWQRTAEQFLANLAPFDRSAAA
jgi:hypothetical protein